MNNANAVDFLNRRTISASVQEYASIVPEGLNAQEGAALASVLDRVTNSRILDLGVGAGRTVGGLRKLSSHYVGVDYVQEMVEHCRSQFPGVRFEQVDARSMTAFEADAFDLVFFSCNGISMVDHDGRMAILKEVQRVLSPRGVFIFSTCNRNSAQYAARFRLPQFQFTKNPGKLAVRMFRFFGHTLFRIANRLRYTRHEVRHAEYSIVNDVCHDYRTMLYFIDIASQRGQLKQAGFQGSVSVYDLAGRVVAGDSRDGTLAYVVPKALEQGGRMADLRAQYPI